MSVSSKKVKGEEDTEVEVYTDLHTNAVEVYTGTKGESQTVALINLKKWRKLNDFVEKQFVDKK